MKWSKGSVFAVTLGNATDSRDRSLSTCLNSVTNHPTLFTTAQYHANCSIYADVYHCVCCPEKTLRDHIKHRARLQLKPQHRSHFVDTMYMYPTPNKEHILFKDYMTTFTDRVTRTDAPPPFTHRLKSFASFFCPACNTITRSVISHRAGILPLWYKPSLQGAPWRWLASSKKIRIPCENRDPKEFTITYSKSLSTFFATCTYPPHAASFSMWRSSPPHLLWHSHPSQHISFRYLRLPSSGLSPETNLSVNSTHLNTISGIFNQIIDARKPKMRGCVAPSVERFWISTFPPLLE